MAMSMPSVDHWVANTTTTSAALASAAAAAGSAPSLKVTSAPGARAGIAFSGADGV